jgi:excisionase family DNA binding protein
MGTRGHLRALPDTRWGDDLVTVEQVQHRLHCSKRTVFRLIGGSNPELPSIKVGRQRLIVAADVDAYIDRLRSSTR